MTPNPESTGYKIWAVDNIVYGPVELSTLLRWIEEERVLNTTWIYSEQEESWKRASEWPELAPRFRRPMESPTAFFASQSDTGARTRLKPGTLRRLKVFAGMNDEQLLRFLDFIEVQTVRQFSQIVTQGEPGAAMFLILEGEVRVRLLIGGKETTLATLPPGECFGEISLFDHGPRSADIIANHDSVLLKISASAFQKLATNAPDLCTPFLLALGKTLTSRIRADNKRLRDSINMARVTGI